MAWDERPYYQDRPQQSGFGARLQGASVVTWLLGINAAVFLLDMVLTSGVRTQGISPFLWGNFNVEQGIFGFQLWRVVTYQFLHGGLLHILFNMIGLYFFGPMMEKWWGQPPVPGFLPALWGVRSFDRYPAVVFSQHHTDRPG